jgi:predicted nucleotidyltransferase
MELTRDWIDISPEQKELILELIQTYLPNKTVWAFGSRVKGKTRFSSDLDLVAFINPEDHEKIYELKEAFEESILPFRVDVLVWHQLSEAFKKIILDQYAILVPDFK